MWTVYFKILDVDKSTFSTTILCHSIHRSEFLADLADHSTVLQKPVKKKKKKKKSIQWGVKRQSGSLTCVWQVVSCSVPAASWEINPGCVNYLVWPDSLRVNVWYVTDGDRDSDLWHGTAALCVCVCILYTCVRVCRSDSSVSYLSALTDNAHVNQQSRRTQWSHLRILL